MTMWTSLWAANQVGALERACRVARVLVSLTFHAAHLCLFPAASGGSQLAKVAAALAESPRFLILDFRQAAEACFFSGIWAPPLQRVPH